MNSMVGYFNTYELHKDSILRENFGILHDYYGSNQMTAVKNIHILTGGEISTSHFRTYVQGYIALSVCTKSGPSFFFSMSVNIYGIWEKSGQHQ